jgi:hypothetical protein
MSPLEVPGARSPVPSPWPHAGRAPGPAAAGLGSWALAEALGELAPRLASCEPGPQPRRAKPWLSSSPGSPNVLAGSCHQRSTLEQEPGSASGALGCCESDCRGGAPVGGGASAERPARRRCWLVRAPGGGRGWGVGGEAPAPGCGRRVHTRWRPTWREAAACGLLLRPQLRAGLLSRLHDVLVVPGEP